MPRHRTTTPDERKRKALEARREPIKLASLVSTLKLQIDDLQRKLASADARTAQAVGIATHELRDELERFRAAKAVHVPHQFADEARSAVEKLATDFLAPLSERWNALDQTNVRMREELSAALDREQALLERVESSARDDAALIGEMNAAKAAQMELLLALRNAYEDGVAPPWLVRFAKAFHDAPNGKLKDEQATALFNRVYRWAMEQARDAARDVKSALERARDAASKSPQPLQVGTSADAGPGSADNAKVIEVADALGVRLVDPVAEEWELRWVDEDGNLAIEVVSASPAAVAQEIAAIVRKRPMLRNVMVETNGVGSIVYETLRQEDLQVWVEAHVTTNASPFPEPALMRLPACGHRKMKEPGECDNTATQERDGGLAVCGQLKPGVIDGKPVPPAGCAHYEMLNAASKSAGAIREALEHTVGEEPGVPMPGDKPNCHIPVSFRVVKDDEAVDEQHQNGVTP